MSNIWSGLEKPLRSSGKFHPAFVAKHQPKFIEGDRVGEWTLLRFIPGSKRGGVRVIARWACRCSCGVEREVSAQNLVAGHAGRRGGSVSCGHLTNSYRPVTG